MTLREFGGGLSEMLKPFRRVVVTIALLLFAGQLLQLLSPYILGRIVNAYWGHATLGVVNQFALYGLAVFFAKNFLGLAREIYEQKNFEHEINLHVSELTLRRLFAWSIAQHRRHHRGLVQSIIVEGQQGLTNAAHLITYEIFEVTSQSLLTIGMIFGIDVYLGFFVLTIAAMFTVTTYYLNRHIKPDLLLYERKKHAVGKRYDEVHRNAAFVLVQGQEEREQQGCLYLHRDLRNLGMRMWVWYCKWSAVRNLPNGVGEYIAVLLGAILIYEKGYAPGSMVTFLFWSRDLFSKMNTIGPIVRKSFRLWPAVESYVDLLETKTEIVEDANPVSPNVIRGQIAAQNVTFWHNRDSGGNPTIVDMNFSISPGENIGIVGSSGAGKSTLVNLLLRATDPNEGKILIDDIDLRRYSLRRYRRAVGFVEQHVPILDRTLRENILFGLDAAEEVSEAWLMEVCRLSRIDEFFDTLSDGFETMLGEQGVRLSGGQCQRVGIARALVKNPAILIFDEATSSLDAENEHLVHEAINQVSQGRTTIIIAHRLATVRNCNRIFVIQDGRLVGEDPHEKLMVNCAPYGALVQRQLIQ